MRSQVCTCTHTQSKAPTHPRAPRTPSPVPWGASAAPGREWWRVAGSHQHGVGPAGPGSPSVMQGQEGPAPHRAPRGREGEQELCPAGGLMGVLGVQGSRGAAGARGHPGVRGQGTVAGLGEEQHAGGEWPHENTCHAGRGVQALAKTGIPPPNDVPGTPHMGLGVPEGGCHPQPGQGGLVALHVGTWFPARGE